MMTFVCALKTTTLLSRNFISISMVTAIIVEQWHWRRRAYTFCVGCIKCTLLRQNTS